MEDNGVLRSDALMDALEKRIAGVYGDALKRALQSQKAFLRKLADVDSGKIKPPAFYDTPEKVLKWRQGFMREAMRQADVAKGIARELAAVGGEVADEMKEAMKDVYVANRAYTCDAIAQGANVSFAQYDRRQLDVLLRENESPFSKLAYKNLSADAGVRRRLQNELAQATVLGESQKEVVKRIRAVTGQSAYQARRVAQTERTRVQSEARNAAISEAAALGVNVSRKWTTRMVNSRDTHADLNGKIMPEGKPFALTDGDTLMFPGDPAGRACNVVNCHCVLVPVVGMPAAAKKARETRGQLGSYEGPEKARKMLREETGMTSGEAAAVMKDLDAYFGNDYKKFVDGEKPTSVARIDKALASMKPFNGDAFRGIHLTASNYDALMGSARTGSTLRMKSISSWSSDERVARRFSTFEQRDSVIFVCKKNRTGVGVNHLSRCVHDESEVLYPSTAKWRVVNVTVKDKTFKNLYNVEVPVKTYDNRVKGYVQSHDVIIELEEMGV